MLCSCLLFILALAPASVGIYPPINATIYDSFLDVTDPENPGYPDGEIDIYDIVAVAIKYGTDGNPQRNVTFVDPVDVNVTNWPEGFPYPSDSGVVAVMITALEWTTRQDFEYGIRVDGTRNLTLPFAFNPIGNAYNVTDVWVKTVFSFKTAPTVGTYQISFNRFGSFLSNPIYGFSSYSQYVYEEATQAPSETAIERGINILDIHSPSIPGGEYIMFHKVDVYIEYEYTV